MNTQNDVNSTLPIEVFATEVSKIITCASRRLQHVEHALAKHVVLCNPIDVFAEIVLRISYFCSRLGKHLKSSEVWSIAKHHLVVRLSKLLLVAFNLPLWHPAIG